MPKKTILTGKWSDPRGLMLKRILYVGLDPASYLSQGDVTHWPVIQIVPRPLSDREVFQALSQFESYSHAIITSKSTISILESYLAQMGMERELWNRKTTLAVGKATEKRLLESGITNVVTAKEETAEGLIKELELLNLTHAHFFWPHSAESRPLLKEFFLSQNIAHTSCVFYQPQTLIPGPLPSLKDFDEIVFTSPSTVKAFLEIFGTFPSGMTLTPIGPVTAHYLEIELSYLHF